MAGMYLNVLTCQVMFNSICIKGNPRTKKEKKIIEVQQGISNLTKADALLLFLLKLDNVYKDNVLGFLFVCSDFSDQNRSTFQVIWRILPLHIYMSVQGRQSKT